MNIHKIIRLINNNCFSSMSQKKRIFVTRDIMDNGVQMLRNADFEVNIWTQDAYIKPLDLIEKLQTHNALISVAFDKLNQEVLEKCSHLDIISQAAAGYDNINVECATQLGIAVCNTPDAITQAAADIAFGLMIAASRKMFFLHKTILSGQWKNFTPKKNLGFQLKNKTLGIFGLGKIGFQFAKRCKGAYNMNIIYFNRGTNQKAQQQLNAKKVSFAQLLALSDILSVHAFLSEETKQIFNKQTFKQMKSSCLFINTARGGFHNERDLIQALENKIIWGAGLDVTNPEPMSPNNPLLSMPNVAVTPHSGSATEETRSQISRQVAMNIIQFYQGKGKEMKSLINPNCLEK